METLKSTKVDWKKIAVVGSIVVLTTAVSVASTWYYVDGANLSEIDSLQNRVNVLEAENERLREGLGVTNQEAEVNLDAQQPERTPGNEPTPNVINPIGPAN